MADQVPYRIGYLFRFQFGRSNLVEEGKKSVIIVPIEKDHRYGMSGKAPGGPEPPEACTDNNYPGPIPPGVAIHFAIR